jgi:inorganic pyrophosphatase
VVNAYIKITPLDLMKYGVDKPSGYLRVDRPQRTSSQPPALFIPQTYCAVRQLASGCERGDADPLDICVISERPINHSEVLLRARVLGGLKIIDRGEADDKIIAVLEGDYLWGNATEITELPAALLECNYLLPYELVPDQSPNITLAGRYGYVHAVEVIGASLTDHREACSEPGD